MVLKILTGPGTFLLSALLSEAPMALKIKSIRQFIMLSAMWDCTCLLSLHTFFISPHLHFLTPFFHFSVLPLSHTQRAFRNLHWKSDLYTFKANCSVPGALWRKSFIELQKEHWASDCTLHEASIFYNFTNYYFRCKW